MLNKNGDPFKNVFIFYIGMTREGIKYERIEYSMFDLISKAGGFINAINKVIVVVVVIACRYNINSKLMYLISQKKANPSCNYKHKKKHIA